MNASQRGRISSHFRGAGTVTRQMVEERAGELARIEGHSHFTQEDFLRAKLELTGVHDSVGPEEEREPIASMTGWDEPPGTSGHRGERFEPADEQTIAEELVQEGVEEAEHEQMVEGTRNRRNQE